MRAKYLLVLLLMVVACRQSEEEEIQNSNPDTGSSTVTLDIKDWS